MKIIFELLQSNQGLRIQRYAAIIILLTSFCIGGYSQVNVRQGTEVDLIPQGNSSTFKSPMVLEYVLSKLRYVPIKREKQSQFLVVEDFKEYDCEKVVLEKLEIARRNTDDPEKRELVIVSHLYTKPPKDKSVTLQFELLVGGEAIAGSTVNAVDVEEQYHIEVKTSISYPRGLVETEPTPILKIVMSVGDDNL